MSSDGDRLAPVTWLFGSPQNEQHQAAESPSESTSAAEPGRSADELRRSADEPGRFARISNVSMNALTRRGMSEQEMRRLLSSREFDADEIETEIDRLASVGLIDDEELAHTLVRTLRDRKGLGRTALAAELARRQLPAAAVEAALVPDDGEFDRAIEIATKRARQTRGLDRETASRRLSAFLLRKGYAGGIVRSVVEQVLSETHARRSGPVFEDLG